MKISGLQLYLVKLIGEFEQFIQLNNLDSEELHVFRINMKEIKIFLSFVEFIDGKNSYAKTLKKMIAPLFITAGDLRNIQVSEGLITKRTIPSKHLIAHEVIEKSKQLSEKLFKKTDSFSHKKFMKLISKMMKHCSQLKDERSLDTAKAQIDKKLHLILKIKRQKIDNKTLHRIRIQLRNVKVLYKMVDHVNPSYIKFKSLENVNRLINIIGEWHDGILLRDHVKSYYAKEKTMPLDEKINTDYQRCLDELGILFTTETLFVSRSLNKH